MCLANSKNIKKKLWISSTNVHWRRIQRERKSIILKNLISLNHQQKMYIGANIYQRAKILIAQLRTNSHQLRCETGRWKRPKEMWEEILCIFCSSGKVETEKHFILECEAFKDSREKYAGILAASSWDNPFSEEFVDKLGAVIVKLHRKRVEYKSQIEKQSVPYTIFSLMDIKNTFFLSFFLVCIRKALAFECTMKFIYRCKILLFIGSTAFIMHSFYQCHSRTWMPKIFVL